MLFMVIEHFHPGQAPEVYRRFRDRGRMAPEELDAGDPRELGRQYRALRSKLPNLNVVGGCCGTDHRHVEEICRALFA